MLPPHLDERTRRGTEPRTDGAFVLYWMRTAVRAHENPALDVALTVAAKIDRPVFVYHALSERYPYASDRHHRFILEGARDVAAELAERGIGYAFHLEREGHRGPHLRTLAAAAALVVTEEMPVAPLRDWTRTLGDVWTVDTACVVPMPLVRRPYDRAFAYRRATESLRRERVGREWEEVEVTHSPFVPELPFEPVELRGADLAELIASCEIDHTIGPAPSTRGGSKAGYARWEAFKREGLARYAADRNDPLHDGVSRMSPYLHYGQVSPLRIAREAHAIGGKGAEKYLDELLVWRELAYAYCFHDEDPDSIATLPDWARETLERHAEDERPRLLSWERTARATTGDDLWDAAQRSLTIHGELHNNVRMTWGKALVDWTPDPQSALSRTIDLNHRFALDGRDPASYGGILWCLGQFDRPFPPERPILGTVRPRTTEQHAKRLDVERYARRVEHGQHRRVAVIGAGISGLHCARSLHDNGLDVVVFDCGRGPGGRLATRDDFDHGAQYFTARDPRFARHVRSWIAEGLVAEWNGRFVAIGEDGIEATSGETTRYVGVPGMRSIAEHLAADLELRRGHTVERLVLEGEGWLVDGEGAFEQVVLAMPPRQAARLIDLPEIPDPRMRPSRAVMLRYAERLPLDFDGAFVNVGPLSWIARNSSKPGRPPAERWVLHGADSGDLMQAFAEIVGTELPEPLERQTHRWGLAIPDEPIAQRCVHDATRGLTLCGDWCGGPRVEGAWLSGAAAAGRVLGG